ncbi:MAG TPA: hypothetical protein VFR08_09185, partial [Candidatus Angelobacter sp.]|nr:hypothetical protein [Candidatus Angelobacter sp.]
NEREFFQCFIPSEARDPHDLEDASKSDLAANEREFEKAFLEFYSFPIRLDFCASFFSSFAAIFWVGFPRFARD